MGGMPRKPESFSYVRSHKAFQALCMVWGTYCMPSMCLHSSVLWLLVGNPYSSPVACPHVLT